MDVQIEPWNEADNGAFSEDAMRRVMAERGFAVSHYVYPPGTVFSEHTHAEDKLEGVVSGRFRMTMGGKSVVLEAGDMLSVPGGVEHRAEVVGEKPVISLDGVRMPPARE